MRSPVRKSFLSAILFLGGIGFFGFVHERQPAWVAIDRVAWDRALDQMGQVYVTTAQVSAARTNDVAAAALARSIVLSKRNTLAAGAKPIPPNFREALEGHFPPNVLNEVRWSLAGRRVDLGSVLARWALTEGAVTLDDVVVFTSDVGAGNIKLWAHELTHVVQYRELGIRDFSRLYTANWRLLEGRARRNATLVAKAIRDEAASSAPFEAN